MNAMRQQKEDFKRLKSLAKKYPRLFARLAALEIEFGKLKAAKKRLIQGLARFPDHTSARTLLAECLSQLGEHESSRKQWEEIVYSEPFNARARAGYVRELAFLERTGEMADAIADYYGLDPLDDEISDRHQEALLREIRRQNPSIRVWNPQWHPGDFTPAGEIARSVSSRLGLTPTRESLPDEFKPEASEEIIDQLVGELEAVTHSAPAGGDAKLMEGDSEEQEALAALFDEGESLDSELSDEDGDVDLELEEMPVEAGEGESELDESSDEEAAHDEEISLDEEAGAVELDEQPSEAAEPEPETAEEAEEEAVEAVEEEEPEAEPEPVDKLVEALEHVEVDSEGMSDIEGLVEELMTDPPYLVEEPVIDIPKSVKEKQATAPDTKAEAKKKEDAGSKGTPTIDVDIEPVLREAGGDSDEDPTFEELEGDLSQDTLDELLSNVSESAGAEESDDDEPMLSDEELASLADEDAEPIATPDAKEPNKVMSQDDLDAMIADRNKASKPEAVEEPAAEEAPAEEAKAESSGPMSQSDLDALIAAQAKPAAPKEPTPPEPEEEAPAAEEKTEEPGGSLSQSDLDALIAAQKAAAPKPATKPEPEEVVEEPEAEEPEEIELKAEPAVEEDDTPSGPLSQADLDALIAAQSKQPAAKAPEESAEPVEPEVAEPEIEAKVEEPAEPIEELPADPRKASSGGALTQDELDAILSGERGEPQEVSYDFSDDEDDDDTPPFVAEDLEGDLDQSLLNDLLNPPSEKDGPPEFHQDMPDDELTQDILDEVFEANKPVEEKEDVAEGDLTQDDLDKLFSDSEGEKPKEIDVAQKAFEESSGTPTLEDLQKKLDALELISDEHKAQTETEDYDSETEDLDRLLAQMSGLERNQESEPTDEAEDVLPEPEPEVVEELEELAIEEEPAEELEEEPVEALEEINLEDELPPPEIDAVEELIEAELEEEEPEAAPPVKSIPSEELEEAMRVEPVSRPTPRPSSEAEVPPEEFKGPLTRTFAKLCLAQGKLDHAEYVVGKLLSDAPADADLVQLQQAIDEKRAGN